MFKKKSFFRHYCRWVIIIVIIYRVEGTHSIALLRHKILESIRWYPLKLLWLSLSIRYLLPFHIQKWNRGKGRNKIKGFFPFASTSVFHHSHNIPELKYHNETEGNHMIFFPFASTSVFLRSHNIPEWNVMMSLTVTIRILPFGSTSVFRLSHNIPK